MSKGTTFAGLELQL